MDDPPDFSFFGPQKWQTIIHLWGEQGSAFFTLAGSCQLIVLRKGEPNLITQIRNNADFRQGYPKPTLSEKDPSLSYINISFFLRGRSVMCEKMERGKYRQLKEKERKKEKGTLW